MQLLSLYRAALQSVRGERVVAAHLHQHPLPGEWAVVSLGKAAASMALGAQKALAGQIHSGLVITKYGHGEPRLDAARWQQLESGHPLPDANSLVAGEALLHYLDTLPQGLPLLFLLSGGASALAEALPEGVDPETLARVNGWLLGAGLSIGEMNAVRMRLSRIKGGRLLQHLGERRCVQLMISDVPGDDPAIIGSAPLMRPQSAPLPSHLPPWLDSLLERCAQPPASASARVESHIIASNEAARLAAAAAAREMGLRVHDHPGHFQGSCESLAREFVSTLCRGGPGIYLWGGESSVHLPATPGRGGRNQHLALLAALEMEARPGCLLLVAASDGSDGPTTDAGALVDGATIRRGVQEGFEPERALRCADSGRFLEASGDLVETGPTGTNVMDIVIGWRVDAD